MILNPLYCVSCFDMDLESEIKLIYCNSTAPSPIMDTWGTHGWETFGNALTGG